MSSGLSISGAVSGMDTASMVNQLISIEATQQTALKTKQTSAQKAADAFGTLISNLDSLADKAKSLAQTAKWQGSTATSSSTSVTATASGNASGSLTFDVTKLARAHTIVSQDAVGSTGAVVASSGTLKVLDKDGAEKASLDVGSGSLAEVVSAINNSSTGLRAAAVQVSPGQYRLQVGAADTGTAKTFSLSGLDGFAGTDVLTAGQDAQITVGTDPATKYTITSASNTFGGVVPNLSFTVSKEETNVTVAAAVDGAGVAKDVKGLVDAANSALADLRKQTAYDSTTKTGGALLGEQSIRSLQQQILSTVGSANAAGVHLTRNGTITFDESEFTKAYKADPAKVASAFGASTTFQPASGVTGSVSFQGSSAATRAGDYAVQLSVASAKETWRIDNAAALAGRTVVVARGAMMMSYTVGAGQSVADIVGGLNTQLAGSGLGGISAESAPPRILFTTSPAGAAGAFNVTVDGAQQTKVQAGVDAAGTINGQAATSNGYRLTLSKSGDRANGLAVDVSGISAADVAASGGNVGTVSYKPGLASALEGVIRNATGSTGTLTTAKEGRLDAVKDLQDAIDSWDRRLEARRSTLTKQFTAMETAISSMQAQASSLSNL